jgi:signal peptidase I
MKRGIKTIVWTAVICIIPVIILDAIGFKVAIQPTESMPKGIYRILPPEHIHKGDIVIFEFPESVAHMKSRMWVPSESGLLMKPVQGVLNDQITVTTDSVYINDIYFGEVKTQDRQELPLPIFKGRHLIKKDFYFVASRHKNSFDSRYFGLITRSTIQGIAKPILTFKED